MSELIDRQAAIDAIRASASKYTGFMEMEMYTDDDAVEAIKSVPTASPWHRVEEPPKESGKQYAVWASKGYAYCDKWLGDRWLISSVAPETVTHWMPIEPPKEDA